MQSHRRNSPYLCRVEEVLSAEGVRESELMAYSVTMRSESEHPRSTTLAADDEVSDLRGLVERQSLQLDKILVQLTRLQERIEELETTRTGGLPTAAARVIAESTDAHSSPPQKRLRKQPAKSLESVWYEWFCSEPRVYESASTSKPKQHEYRHAVAYMMLFMEDRLTLDRNSEQYKRSVCVAGEAAAARVLEFLRGHDSAAVASGSEVKALRQLLKKGALDTYLSRFGRLVDEGRIVEPTPITALPAFLRFGRAAQ